MLLIILILYLSNIGCCIKILDPRNQFYNYDLVQPSVYSLTRKKRDVNFIKAYDDETLTLGFTAFKKEFILNLVMNKNLLSENYFEKYHENGENVIQRPVNPNSSKHCHYQGSIQGSNSSLVAVSLCNGVSGVVFDEEEYYYIEPDYNSKNRSHFVFRSSDIKPDNFLCGVSDTSTQSFSTQYSDELQRHRRAAVRYSPYKSNKESRFVELVIVNDNKEYKAYNQSKKTIFERSKQIANIVNGLYSPLNIFIALVGVIVWSERDEIKLSTDGDATLTNFLHYRRERLAQEHPNDNAQLITAITFDGGVVGKALKGPICTYEYSGGVNMDHSPVVGLVATTVAHELGHNFGMEHDADECHCPDSKCIMAPSSSSMSPRHWSSCSLEYLKHAYARGMDYCLKNKPSSVIGPTCGNGFLEEGEECDCGLKEFCDNHCCNSTTCQLFQNASCATGDCCDIATCQMKKMATKCRESKSDCDFPEFCDGVSEFCPDDTYHQNGEECGNGKAYCFNGKCRSHADQCKLLWGETGKMSDLKCYEQNFKGNVNGNCGFNRMNKTYKACNKQDVLCGMLHCIHLNEKLEFGMESAAILTRSYITIRGKVFTCRSAIVDLGLYDTDPGLTPDGAKCGAEKMCLNQKCVPVNSVKKVCPFNCSGNGICNNKGNCHCINGYGPPYCNSLGPGGSIDSGPVAVTKHVTSLMLFTILFIFLLLILFFAIVFYYYRSHIKTWWIAKVRKAAIKSRAKNVIHKKTQLSSKFKVEHNNLRSLEISAPIPDTFSSTQGSDVSSLLQETGKTEHLRLYSKEPTIYKPTTSDKSSLQSNKFIPVRPAPAVPVAMPENLTETHTAARTSIRIPSTKITNANERPLSMSASRPTCPPPRPPLHRTTSHLSGALKQKASNIHPSDTKRASTPTSVYYDDCQTLDFSDTPLAFVHQVNEIRYEPKIVKTSDAGTSKPRVPATHKIAPTSKHTERKNLEHSNVSNLVSEPVDPQADQHSHVAKLAQRFESQKNKPNPDCSDKSLRPPFKSRPLPPRPDNKKT